MEPVPSVAREGPSGASGAERGTGNGKPRMLMANAERGTLNSFLLTLALVLAPAALQAQAAAPALEVMKGAHVRAKVPTLGTGWFYGSFAHARSSMGDCLGVGLVLPKYPKDTMLVMIGGLKLLEVDRRTNSDIPVIGLDAPADSDWQKVDLRALAKGDTGCKTSR